MKRLKNFLENVFLWRSLEKFLWKIFFFFGDRLKNFCEDFFFLESTCACVLGPWPWPRECLSSEKLSLALASVFFCVLGLGLEPCVLDSTSARYSKVQALKSSSLRNKVIKIIELFICS